MKRAFAILTTISFAAGAAVAEPVDRASYQPSGALVTVLDTAPVPGKAPSVVRPPNPAPTAVSDVDRNQDGRVSFAELALQDLVSGF